MKRSEECRLKIFIEKYSVGNFIQLEGKLESILIELPLHL
jgi:hypothetical protein